ncbi:MAG: T9SS type A sorting domain-containing protein [Bacteroidetes bacterium]|nr:T9SS type A sorting domain-containing protein [Bacteroidota bacterium]
MLLSVPATHAQQLPFSVGRGTVPESVSENLFPAVAEDLIVGFPNPNEVREIRDDLDVDGNVFVVNNGRLRVRDARLLVRGDVAVLHNGGIEILGGSLEFGQSYLYQRSITLLNKGSLWLNDAGMQCGGYNVGCVVTDTAVLRLDASAVSGGVMTTTLGRHASIEANGSQRIGEVLFFDSTRGSFSGCDGLLTWLTLPSGSASDITLPGTQVLGGWVFPDSLSTSAGFDYRVSWDGCTNLLWGLMLEPSCAAFIRNSSLLAVGGLFNGSGSGQVTGLVNNAVPKEYDYPAADRNVRFENCEVRVWNLYTSDAFQLTVGNSIIGEILAMGHSDALIQNSICDGTGGYVGCRDDATMLFVNSQVTAPCIARDRGQLTLLLSSLQTHIPHAADNGVVALFNSTSPGLPTVESGAVGVVMGVDRPREAEVDSDVPVIGSMRFIAGEDVTIHFRSHWFEVVRSDVPDDVLFASRPSIVERVHDTLGVWDTRGHAAGNYLLNLHMRLSSDDVIVVPTPVKLTEPTVHVSTTDCPRDFRITAVYPQPLRRGGQLMVDVDGADVADAEIRIVDLLGRSVIHRRVERAGSIRISLPDLPPGTYMLSLRKEGVLRMRPISLFP